MTRMAISTWILHPMITVKTKRTKTFMNKNNEQNTKGNQATVKQRQASHRRGVARCDRLPTGRPVAQQPLHLLAPADPAPPDKQKDWTGLALKSQKLGATARPNVWQGRLCCRNPACCTVGGRARWRASSQAVRAFCSTKARAAARAFGSRLFCIH